MVRSFHAPSKGDLIWIDFDPVMAHEQKGRRPALVISPRSYNARTGLAIMCPITSRKKQYPFEVSFMSKKVSGVILSDHVRNMSWKNGNAEYIESINREALMKAIARVRDLIELDEDDASSK